MEAGTEGGKMKGGRREMGWGGWRGRGRTRKKEGRDGERRSEGREQERLTMSCMCVCVNLRSGTVSISPILK